MLWMMFRWRKLKIYIVMLLIVGWVIIGSGRFYNIFIYLAHLINLWFIVFLNMIWFVFLIFFLFFDSFLWWSLVFFYIKYFINLFIFLLRPLWRIVPLNFLARKDVLYLSFFVFDLIWIGKKPLIKTCEKFVISIKNRILVWCITNWWRLISLCFLFFILNTFQVIKYCK